MSKVKYLSLTTIFLFALTIIGCTVRTYTVTKDRVDQNLAGNRGYLSGDAPTVEGEPRSKTRKTSVMEIEFGSFWGKDKEAAAVTEEPQVEYVSEPMEEAYDDEDFLAEEPAIVTEEEMTYTSYEIQKDDTLQKISKKFYGTYRKWKKIYEANESVIKDPNRIKPGIIIQIPQE